MQISRGAHDFSASRKYNTALPPPRRMSLSFRAPGIRANRTRLWRRTACERFADNSIATANVRTRHSTTYGVIIGSAPVPGAARLGPVMLRPYRDWNAGWRERSCYPKRPACIQFIHEGSRGETHVE